MTLSDALTLLPLVEGASRASIVRIALSRRDWASSGGDLLVRLVQGGGLEALVTALDGGSLEAQQLDEVQLRRACEWVLVQACSEASLQQASFLCLLACLLRRSGRAAPPPSPPLLLLLARLLQLLPETGTGGDTARLMLFLRCFDQVREAGAPAEPLAIALLNRVWAGLACGPACSLLARLGGSLEGAAAWWVGPAAGLAACAVLARVPGEADQERACQLLESLLRRARLPALPAACAAVAACHLRALPGPARPRLLRLLTRLPAALRAPPPYPAAAPPPLLDPLLAALLCALGPIAAAAFRADPPAEAAPRLLREVAARILRSSRGAEGAERAMTMEQIQKKGEKEKEEEKEEEGEKERFPASALVVLVAGGFLVAASADTRLAAIELLRAALADRRLRRHAELLLPWLLQRMSAPAWEGKEAGEGGEGVEEVRARLAYGLLGELCREPHLVPAVLRSLQQGSGEAALGPAAWLRLQVRLWRAQERLFPRLQALLETHVSALLREAPRSAELPLAVCASLRDVCRAAPRRAADVVRHLSRLLDAEWVASSGRLGELVAALCLEALEALCRADELDPPTAWQVLARKPHLRALLARSALVQARLCGLAECAAQELEQHDLLLLLPDQHEHQRQQRQQQAEEKEEAQETPVRLVMALELLQRAWSGLRGGDARLRGAALRASRAFLEAAARREQLPVLLSRLQPPPAALAAPLLQEPLAELREAGVSLLRVVLEHELTQRRGARAQLSVVRDAGLARLLAAHRARAAGAYANLSAQPALRCALALSQLFTQTAPAGAAGSGRRGQRAGGQFSWYRRQLLEVAQDLDLEAAGAGDWSARLLAAAGWLHWSEELHEEAGEEGAGRGHHHQQQQQQQQQPPPPLRELLLEELPARLASAPPHLAANLLLAAGALARLQPPPLARDLLPLLLREARAASPRVSAAPLALALAFASPRALAAAAQIPGLLEEVEQALAGAADVSPWASFHALLGAGLLAHTLAQLLAQTLRTPDLQPRLCELARRLEERLLARLARLHPRLARLAPHAASPAGPRAAPARSWAWSESLLGALLGLSHALARREQSLDTAGLRGVYDVIVDALEPLLRARPRGPLDPLDAALLAGAGSLLPSLVLRLLRLGALSPADAGHMAERLCAAAEAETQAETEAEVAGTAGSGIAAAAAAETKGGKEAAAEGQLALAAAQLAYALDAAGLPQTERLARLQSVAVACLRGGSSETAPLVLLALAGSGVLCGPLHAPSDPQAAVPFAWGLPRRSEATPPPHVRAACEALEAQLTSPAAAPQLQAGQSRAVWLALSCLAASREAAGAAAQTSAGEALSVLVPLLGEGSLLRELLGLLAPLETEQLPASSPALLSDTFAALLELLAGLGREARRLPPADWGALATRVMRSSLGAGARRAALRLVLAHPELPGALPAALSWCEAAPAWTLPLRVALLESAAPLLSLCPLVRLPALLAHLHRLAFPPPPPPSASAAAPVSPEEAVAYTLPARFFAALADALERPGVEPALQSCVGEAVRGALQAVPEVWLLECNEAPVLAAAEAAARCLSALHARQRDDEALERELRTLLADQPLWDALLRTELAWMRGGSWSRARAMAPVRAACLSLRPDSRLLRVVSERAARALRSASERRRFVLDTLSALPRLPQALAAGFVLLSWLLEAWCPGHVAALLLLPAVREAGWETRARVIPPLLASLFARAPRDEVDQLALQLRALLHETPDASAQRLLAPLLLALRDRRAGDSPQLWLEDVDLLLSLRSLQEPPHPPS
jgi:hypothetical protein